MKTDREIALEAYDWWINQSRPRASSEEKAIELARQYGSLEAAKPAIDWERVRIDAAIAAMQGLWANVNAFGALVQQEPAIIADWAAKSADALVAELNREAGE